MTEQPGLPLTTGEGNTARERAENTLSKTPGPHASDAQTLARDVLALLAECERLTRERDTAYDQKAMLHDSLEAAREQLDAERAKCLAAMENHARLMAWTSTLVKAVEAGEFGQRGDGRPTRPWGKRVRRPRPWFDHGRPASTDDSARAALGVEGPAAGDGQP